MYDRLVRNGRVKSSQGKVPELDDERRTALIKSLAEVNTTKWTEEKNMYSPIQSAIEKGLSTAGSGIVVVDTHAKGEFHGDISVAYHEDDRLPHSLQYFVELKLRGGNIKTSENCGQMIDYIEFVHGKQPLRQQFVGILSDFESSWVFTAKYDQRGDITISEQFANTLADAVIYADQLSKQQYRSEVPTPDSRLGSPDSILAVSHNHFLFAMSQPNSFRSRTKGSGSGIPTHDLNTRSKQKRSDSEEDSWHDPCRHIRGPRRFALKIVNGNTSLANEIEVLKIIRDISCQNLPEIVWSPPGGKELGIVPVGQPIDFREPSSTSRIIVRGLMEGLRHLHEIGIVHRDIRPSNLILDYTKNKVNLVIIDFEKAVVVEEVGSGISYEGAYIGWPWRLLKENVLEYKPEPQDDLLASILVVLHMLFPMHFNAFKVSDIGVVDSGKQSRETEALVKLWGDIRESRIWGDFVKAAEREDYERLKDMADVFCCVELFKLGNSNN
jgi:hypothetical protein